jgi:hypothetical protein
VGGEKLVERILEEGGMRELVENVFDTLCLLNISTEETEVVIRT